MITKYFTKVSVRFNPFGPEAKSARLFLASIPPSMKGSCSIDNKLLDNKSTTAPLIKVTFKDKSSMETDPSKLNFNEVSNFFDTHSRKLALKESIESS